MRNLREDIEAKLRAFIVDELLDEDVGEEDPLAADALDSLGLEQLVKYIEGEFEISIKSEEMRRRNFKSLPILRAFLEAKMAETRA